MKYLIIILIFFSFNLNAQISEDVILKSTQQSGQIVLYKANEFDIPSYVITPRWNITTCNEPSYASYREVEELKAQVEYQRNLIEELKSEIQELSFLFIELLNKPK